MAGVTKSFPVFDCDAHIHDPAGIWEYVPEASRELARQSYWIDKSGTWLNGKLIGSQGGRRREGTPGMYNPITIAGPQMNKKIMRRLQVLRLTDEQRDYVDHKGAYDPHERVKDMDLMGIDQVLVIGTMINNNLLFIDNPDGARVFCEAYNNWLRDWCSAEPGRLFGAGILPVHRPEYAVAEVHRLAELGFPAGLVRPIDARGGYPSYPNNKVGPSAPSGGSMDQVFKAFEETGVCCAMHTFPCPLQFGEYLGAEGAVASPGDLVHRTGVSSNTLSFIFEAQDWLSQVLLSGFLDRYPKLKMLIFESNSQWLIYLLAECDRLFKLFRNERELPATRLPSEAFYDQCAISFESDEVQTFRQWPRYRDVGIWASDAYHHDGADAWSAIREMRQLGVPDDAQAQLMGSNACRMYGIEPKLFVTDEPSPIDRPGWFPRQDDSEFLEWAELIKYPRSNAARLAELGGSGVGYRAAED
jgi:predicted TIM-barrel fold metal-dependent hydrolase